MILFETEIIGGLVGDALDKTKEKATDLIVDGFLKGCGIILRFIIQFGFIVCETGIILCLLIYFCSKDKKSVTLIIKLSFIYLLLAIIWRAL